MEKQTIRQHLKELTDRYSDVDKYTASILDDCEKRANQGLDWHIALVLNDRLADTVEYLVSVAKLTVEVTKRGDTMTTVEISWSDEKG